MYRALILCLLPLVIYGHQGKDLCRRLDLQPGTKAMIQWERIFKSKQRQKNMGIDKLSNKEKEELKRYLLDHAADSAHPMVPGL